MRSNLPNLDFTAKFYRQPYSCKVILGGMALADKVAEQVRDSGAYRAAANLRKQGISLDVALCLITGRVPIHPT